MEDATKGEGSAPLKGSDMKVRTREGFGEGAPRSRRSRLSGLDKSHEEVSSTHLASGSSKEVSNIVGCTSLNSLTIF